MFGWFVWQVNPLFVFTLPGLIGIIAFIRFKFQDIERWCDSHRNEDVAKVMGLGVFCAVFLVASLIVTIDYYTDMTEATPKQYASIKDMVKDQPDLLPIVKNHLKDSVLLSGEWDDIVYKHNDMIENSNRSKLVKEITNLTIKDLKTPEPTPEPKPKPEPEKHKITIRPNDPFKVIILEYEHVLKKFGIKQEPGALRVNFDMPTTLTLTREPND